jgi:aminoglycoside phosphotransferase family enzyme/predicted kinase
MQARQRSERLAHALLDPAAYPDASPVEHVETHISHVYLTGAHAYKIKKPVELGFLDFSTLEKRRRFCEEELRINRRLAPRIYLSVVPIAGTWDAPRVEGAGTPIEYAVKMRRFAQEDVLDRIAESGRLQPEHVDELARQVTQFHHSAEIAGTDDRLGTAQRVRSTAEQNISQLEALVAGAARSALDRLGAWTREQGARLDSTFAQRKAQGFVRECHGDLHLGNIALFDGEIVVFDALEFDASLRWTDTMNDLAFLSMDLRAHGRPDLAARFVDACLSHSADYDGLQVLRYYEVYRALVRAKVSALRAAQPGVDAQRRGAIMQRCAALVDLAGTIAQPPTRALVLLHGVSGSGKTWGSQHMLEATGAVRIRSDVERRRMQAMAAGARSGSDLGAGLYTQEITRATYARLAQLAQSILRAGYPVLVDATFLRAQQRDAFARIARDERAALRIACFVADDDVLRERVQQRQAAGTDASEATLEVLEQQLRTREPLSEAEAACAMRFDTSTMSPAQIGKAARVLMQARAGPVAP